MAYRIPAWNKRSQESREETPPDVAPSREAKEKANRLETEPEGLKHARLSTSQEYCRRTTGGETKREKNAQTRGRRKERKEGVRNPSVST